MILCWPSSVWPHQICICNCFLIKNMLSHGREKKETNTDAKLCGQRCACCHVQTAMSALLARQSSHRPVAKWQDNLSGRRDRDVELRAPIQALHVRGRGCPPARAHRAPWREPCVAVSASAVAPAGANHFFSKENSARTCRWEIFVWFMLF